MEVDYFDTKSSTLFDCVAVYMAYTQDHLVYEEIALTVDDKGMTLRDPNGAKVQCCNRMVGPGSVLETPDSSARRIRVDFFGGTAERDAPAVVCHTTMAHYECVVVEKPVARALR